MPYRDGGEHFAGQLGSEPTPLDFLRAQWAWLDEVWRVLRVDGSAWVNYGDKYAGSGGHNIDMFGLNPGALCAQFAAYVDHFGVRREAAAWRPLRHATAPVAA